MARMTLLKRRFPRSLWIGLLLVLAAPVLYGTVFVRFAITRDVPWTMLLMFAAGLGLLVHATRHARSDRVAYRGSVAAPAVLAIAVALAGFFSYAVIIGTRDIPASAGAPRIGDRAPDFTLPDQDGRPVSLAELLAPAPAATPGAPPPLSGATPGGEAGAGHPGGVVLVFYRGYW
jgi:hypothetical protein